MARAARERSEPERASNVFRRIHRTYPRNPKVSLLQAQITRQAASQISRALIASAAQLKILFTEDLRCAQQEHQWATARRTRRAS